MSAEREAIEEFDCFASRCAALVIGPGQAGTAHEAAALIRRTLLAWHERFSRFQAGSELSRLNRDPRETVPVSPLMARFAQAVREAGTLSGGLVDGTLVGELERAGYAGDLREPLALTAALALAPARKPAAAAAAGRWRQLEVDLEAGTITRPPGLMLDGGGLAKGLFADLLGEALATHAGFAVNCAGDLLVGGAKQIARAIKVESPFDGRTLHTFELSRTGVATSGIGRRSWRGRDGAPAHHLLDPSSGRPAFTGVVQVTALAPSALAAEIYAKAALLSGPQAAHRWLAHGGVIVYDDGSHEVVTPAPVVTLEQLYATSSRSAARPNAALSCSVSSAAGSGRAIT
ncbi:MAG: FAD:protein FMN transferase [Solirubrobacteraceae bacterium]